MQRRLVKKPDGGSRIIFMKRWFGCYWNAAASQHPPPTSRAAAWAGMACRISFSTPEGEVKIDEPVKCIAHQEETVVTAISRAMEFSQSSEAYSRTTPSKPVTN